MKGDDRITQEPKSVLECMLSQFSHVLLFVTLGSSVRGISQARILEQVAIYFSRGSSDPGTEPTASYFSCIGRWVLYNWHHLGSLLGLIVCLYLVAL